MSKIIYIYLSLFLFIVGLSTSFASNSIEEKINVYRISEDYSWIDQFLKSDLSDKDIESINLIYSDFRKKQIQYWVSWSNCSRPMSLDITKFYQDLLGYVADNKVASFKDYTQNNATISTWRYNSKCTVVFSKNERKRLLTEWYLLTILNKYKDSLNQLINIKQALNTKLKTIKSDKNRQIILEIVDYIDILIQKAEEKEISWSLK